MQCVPPHARASHNLYTFTKPSVLFFDKPNPRHALAHDVPCKEARCSLDRGFAKLKIAVGDECEQLVFDNF